MGDGDGLPGPTDAWITLAGLARETVPDPARHAGDPGDVPAARPARHRGRPGRRDERRPGRARPRRRLVRRASTRRTASRSRRWASASTGSRSSSRSSPGCGRRRSASAFSFEGEHYQLTDSPALPKPVQQPRPPVIVGGGGRAAHAALAARYADEFNMPFASVERTAAQFDRVRAACERPAATRRAGAAPPRRRCAAASDDAEVRAAGRRRSGGDVDELRANGLAGTPAEVVEQIGRYAEVGADPALPAGPRPRTTSTTSSWCASEVTPQLR